MMGMIAYKIWGSTKCLFENNNFEVHRIGIYKDGYCSKHMHMHKVNCFYVEAGKLKVRVWKKDYNLCDETILGPGDIMDVKPGEYHQFEAAQDTIAFEIYYSEPISGDIIRESVGGRINE
jgi:mannose-6-phosphate isomerase-like protein (cupin superfamily)